MATKKKGATPEDLKGPAEELLKILKKNRDAVTKPKSVKKPKDTPEIAKRLQSVMDKADFGCQGAHVAEAFSAIASAISGQKVEIKRKTRSCSTTLWAPKTLIVPLTCKNDHNYTLGVPALTATWTRLRSATNFVGNYMDEAADAWRYATDEEIEGFVKTSVFFKTTETLLAYVK